MPEDKLRKMLVREKIRFIEKPSLKEYSTFKVGGFAHFLINPITIEETSKTVKFLHENSIKYMGVGNGSNILFSDTGYNGVIILLDKNLDSIKINNEFITAPAGVNMFDLCEVACKHSLSGLEFAYGIPGAVGGTLYMNAGAYNGEMKDVVYSCRYVTEKGDIKEADINELNLSYRHSLFTDTNYIIFDVTYKLKHFDKEKIKEKMDDLYGQRVLKQPLEFPSAGSTFKRPEGNYASALIDKCGLKGRRVGGAMVSEKHAGFIINYKDATSKEILDLVKVVQEEVKKQTGYCIECEIKLIEP